MDNVLIVVDDLEAAQAFFVELVMELESQTTMEGPWVDRIVGLENVRSEIAMMRTPDGHGRIELDKFHAPTAVRTEPKNKPVNTLGIRRIMFAVDDIEDVLARLRAHGAELIVETPNTRTCTGSATFAVLRVSSLRLPSNSDKAYLHGRKYNWLTWRQARHGLAISRSLAYNTSFEPTARPQAS
jgi:catechol 2,3-dioxygenase-like lactoylglutathione lyase family enzyme